MSISHQRRQGEGTVDGQTLDWAKRPDLYKMAVLYCPSQTLIPITKSWEIGINENAVNDLSLNGLYFGKWILNHNSQDRADNNNGKKRSQAFLKYADDVVARTMIIVSGDDILAWGTETTEHYGFATSLHLHKLEEDQQPQHGVTLSFIGFLVNNLPGFLFPPPLVVNNPNLSGNIGLTAQDLTNAGYTYQWSDTSGTGFFTNPNSPNTQYVPSANGNYVLELVVTDSTGVVSAPVVVPVVVSLTGKLTIVNVGTVSVKYVPFTLAIGETRVVHFTGAPYNVPLLPFDINGVLLEQIYQDGEPVTGWQGSGAVMNTGIYQNNLEVESLVNIDYSLRTGHRILNSSSGVVTTVIHSDNSSVVFTTPLNPASQMYAGYTREVKYFADQPFKVITDGDGSGVDHVALLVSGKYELTFTPVDNQFTTSTILDV